jgi:hypothetical protein
LFFGFIFCPFSGYRAAAGAVEMWKSGAFGFCRISKPGGKSGKLALGFWSFPRFPRGVISTALFTLQFSERTDALARPAPPWFLLRLGASFFVLGQKLKPPQKNLAPG